MNELEFILTMKRAETMLKALREEVERLTAALLAIKERTHDHNYTDEEKLRYISRIATGACEGASHE